MSVIDKLWSIWRIILLVNFLFLNNGITFITAEGRIGCLFAEALCSENGEWCYDDFAFGKCLPEYGVETNDLLREVLNEEQSGFLATMLEDLQGARLGWEHPFVQCRMQGALYSIRNQTPMPNNLCANLAPDPEILGPQSPLAFVRFIPPNDNFADEVYYPPATKKAFDDRLYINRPPVKSLEFIPNDMNYNGNIDENQFPKLTNRDLKNRQKDIKNRIELRRMFAEYESGKLTPPIYYKNQVFDGDLVEEEAKHPHFQDNNKIHSQPENPKTENYLKELARKELENQHVIEILDGFRKTKKDNKPKESESTSFRELSRSQHIPLESSIYDPVPVELPEDLFSSQKGNRVLVNSETEKKLPNGIEENSDYLKNNVAPSSDSGVYTEGGLVYVPEESKTEARNLLRDIMGFTRHERLDVKKPGPPASPPLPHLSPNETPDLTTLSKTKEVLPEHLRSINNLETQKTKKIQIDHDDDEDHAPHSVDTEYAHVILKNPIDSWASGSRIVNAIGEMLNIKLSHHRIDRHEVSFRIEPNAEKKTAADVAKFINDARFKNNLSRRLGIIVIKAGVGDKTKETNSSVHAEKIDESKAGPDVTHVIAYMIAGAGTAALIVTIITLFLIKKHDKKRDKLGGLQSGIVGSESCTKDYQELCRARMAGKGSSTESASGRIASLSKEEVKPPSSRSSTSSWSEEPALTNMDISTGHMVLSYMEDHLRNKGRLHREWEALCRYEAEPNAREAALQPLCAPLNRPGSPLPFDHSRVVLNHLTNAEGMDYINASTITDHDPRAPAYVAAQGPLTATLAHFWQMIWEQGAVVIVALCRLQENGQVACARYWPEEGSEVYHIYEVHLVSEHIWCDDYLVRSFYLKNLRTGETRTVTQFHFLSWPQSGVPSSAKALLEFRRKVNKSYRGRSCPIVVHSSNGAGRTGAYILLDLVLARMNKGAREIDIAATLEHLRDQRASLVATRPQFEFVLMAVAEEVHAILKALPANTQSTEKRDIEKDPIKEKGEEETTTKSPKTNEK